MVEPQTERAEPVRAPEPTSALLRARAAAQVYQAEREGVARKSTVRGLLMLGLVLLAASAWRAGLGRAFPPGWWHR